MIASTCRNKLYSPTVMFPRFFLIITFLFLGTSCGSVVNGKIFLDENNNLTKEESEPALAGVVLAVSRDGKAQGEVVTDSEGKFRLEVDPAKIGQTSSKSGETAKVKYCVKIQQASLSTQAVQVAALETIKDPYADSQGSSTTTSGSSGIQQQVGALEACKDGSGIVEIDVALSPKYDKIVSKIAVPETKTLTIGDRTTLSVCYPTRCQLQPFLLPEGLEPCGAGLSGPQFNTITRQMVVPVDLPSSTSGSTGVPGGELKCDPVCLQLNDRAAGELSFSPEAICKDDQTIALHKHVIKVEKLPDILVEHSIASGSLALGQTVTIRALARNNSQRDFKGGKLIIELPSFSTIQISPEGCSNLGQKVECLTDIAKGAEFSKEVTFQLPAEINGDTTFKVSTSFTPASGTAVTATEISQAVVDPTPPQSTTQ